MDDLIALLHAAARTLADQRAWVIEPVGTPPPPGRGPGFVYRWDDGPLALRFHPSGGAVFGNAARSFAIEMDGGALRLLAPGSAPLATAPLPPDSLARVRDLIRRSLAANAEPGVQSDLTLTASAMQLVALALDTSGRPTLSPRELAKQELATRLHRWLESNLNPPPTPADAAAALGSIPRGLTRVLQDTTGMGFAGHLAIHRLLAARSQLMRTGMTVNEIATASGFSSREPFIRSFHSTFGRTPLQFRKAWLHASTSTGSLAPLCRLGDRLPVVSHPESTEPDATMWTLVLANGLHEIIELFPEADPGSRVAILERGEMSLVPRCAQDSTWLCRAPGSELEFRFAIPAGHALALMESET